MGESPQRSRGSDSAKGPGRKKEVDPGKSPVRAPDDGESIEKVGKVVGGLLGDVPGGLGGILKTISSFTRREWALAVILALVIAVVYLLAAYFNSPYMAKQAEISATGTQMALLMTHTAQASVIEATQSAAKALLAPPTLAPTSVPLLPSGSPSPNRTPTATPVDTDKEPFFDISIPWDVDQTGVIEVTNNLIGAAASLSEPGNRYQVASAGLELTIDPTYTGEVSYGEVQLLVSGAGGALTKTLWSDFSNASKPKVIQITLAEIIDLSGVKRLEAAPDTNLHIAFPRYPLKLEVIRTGDPKHPLAGGKEIAVVNTPWVQQTELAWRDDGWVLDYTIQNLGVDGEFGYLINLVKTYGPVTVTGHPIYSGTVGVEGGGGADGIFLKHGETYTTSVPLGKGLAHGRYIAEAFTYKKPPFLEFEPAVTYEDYAFHYLFATPDDDTVFVLCNDPGLTCEQTVAEPIERRGISVFPYHITEQPESGYIYYSTGAWAAQDTVQTEHTVKYQLDPQVRGYAGIAIQFDSANDFNAYNFLRFDLQFYDDDGDGKEPRLYMDFFSTDPVTKEDRMKRVVIGDGVYARDHGDPQTVLIPFKDLADFDLAHITKINILGDETTVKDAREHEFTISKIELIDTTGK